MAPACATLSRLFSMRAATVIGECKFKLSDAACWELVRRPRTLVPCAVRGQGHRFAILTRFAVSSRPVATDRSF